MATSPLRSPWFVLLLFALCASLAAPDDGEILKEFRKYFRKYKDTPTRVEAVLALEDCQLPGVVDVLLPVLKSGEREVVEAAVRVMAGFESRPAIDRLLAKLADAKGEEVRTGLLRAVTQGRYSGAREALVECLQDSSWDVRRRAVQALAATGGEGVPEALLPLCEDKEVAVRCAALEGLSALHSELVLPAALADLTHETWQVRASAILALERVRSRDSIEPLIGRLRAEDGRLRADIGRALARITGRNFGVRVEGWERFWEIYRDRFVIPTDAELKKLEAKRKERAEAYSPPGAVSFGGIETPSRSILFVIDVSGSMEQEVNQRERFADGDYPSFKRIDIVKTELSRTVESLESYVTFNILSFATEVDRWKKRLVPANVLNKSSAMSWAGRLEAIGGASKEDLASVGLTSAANLEAGKTNTYGALMAALEVAGRGKRDKHYDVAVDTIFFLSDGRPSHGEFVDPDDILREVRQANELRKVVIHTIAIGEFEKDFMRRLAEDNGGVFVDLGS